MTTTPYNGTASDANWAVPVEIINDGTPWQFGNGVTGAGGFFGIYKPILDRLAWLKAHHGALETDNEWTGEQIFVGDVTVDEDSGWTFDGDLNVTANGSISLGNGAVFNASGTSAVGIESTVDLTINAAIQRSAAAAAIAQRHQVGNDADMTITPSQYDVMRVPAITDNRTYTLNAPAGNVSCYFEIFWWNEGESSGNGIDVWGPAQGASTSGKTLTIEGTGGMHIEWPVTPSSVDPRGPNFYRAKFHFNGTAWRCIDLQRP